MQKIKTMSIAELKQLQKQIDYDYLIDKMSSAAYYQKSEEIEKAIKKTRLNKVF